MSSLRRPLALSLLFLAANCAPIFYRPRFKCCGTDAHSLLTAATLKVVLPASQGAPDSVDNPLDLGLAPIQFNPPSTTSTRKQGPLMTHPPTKQPVKLESVTAIDAQLVNATVAKIICRWWIR